MKNKLWVISLGGSRIIPKNFNYKFLEDFKNLIYSHKSHKFVVVTGGGSTARRYINALRKLNRTTRSQSLSGIAVTRFHAGFMSRFFGKPANEIVPRNMRKVKNLLLKNQIVFCGALRYEEKNTSDGTAANLAAFLECPFINLTNVKGLYTSNPIKNKKAKFIKNISWKDFNNRAKKIKYEAGQHFVLDQNAAKIIKDGKIPTYIIGSLSDMDYIVRGKKFVGTIVEG